MKVKRKERSIAERDLVIRHMSDGKKVREVATILKIPFSTVQYIWTKHRKGLGVANVQGRGRKKILNDREERKVLRAVENDRRLSAAKVAAQVFVDTGKSVSPETVRRTIRRKGLNGRVARKKPFISNKNKKRRLAFARDHVGKSPEYWDQVLWSDESKFNIFGSDGRIMVWRRPGEALKTECLRATVKHGGGSVMVWGCMAANGVGNIEFINGIMVKEIYEGILDRNLLSSARKLGFNVAKRKFTFQQDNDPKHTAGLINQFFTKKRIKKLDWPPYSPDLNPIEHLWSEIERKIRTYYIKNKEDLKKAISDAWLHIEPEKLRKLVQSMPRRLEQVIKNKGGPTSY